ncbi:MAG: hypothetical protein GY762_19135 [Proteobacteria bacterium]|nr:hypothetical protein [Pseudomonadota bacterium]
MIVQRYARIINQAVMVPALLLSVFVVACAGTLKKAPAGDPGEQVMKMRHQILFRYGEEEHVFEGYMILKKGAFFVKAFAGPGVNLFTLVREGTWHREELHIGSLKGKIDLDLVSASIAKVYLGRCAGAAPDSETACDFYGEKMVETYGDEGELVTRQFFSEERGDLVIRYSELISCGGGLVPKKIVLTWQKGEITMVIRLVACDLQGHVEPGIWQR